MFPLAVVFCISRLFACIYICSDVSTRLRTGRFKKEPEPQRGLVAHHVRRDKDTHDRQKKQFLQNRHQNTRSPPTKPRAKLPTTFHPDDDPVVFNSNT